MNQKGIVVVVSGFSGSGKGTIMRKLVEKYDSYALSVSMTTREPREGEVNGVDYFFVEREDFTDEIASGGLIEYTCYCDHYYGTPRKYIEEQLEDGKDVILEIEVEGASQIRDIFPDALLLFVTPPSIEELRQRLEGRSTETGEEIDKRLHRTREEFLMIGGYDYVIINQDIDSAVEDVHAAISTAHMTPYRRENFLASLKTEIDLI